MAIKLNVGLLHIRATAEAINGMHAERVHIGPIEPTCVGTKPHIVIAMDSNSPQRTDGDEMRRTVRVTIAVLMRIDTVEGDADIQINETYEPMHAAYEALRDGVENKFLTFEEVAGSLSYDTLVFQQVPIRSASAEWDMTFDRALGATE